MKYVPGELHYEDVGEVFKSNTVKISVQKVVENEYLSVREFRVIGGEWRPSFAGFTCKKEVVPDLVKALEAIGDDTSVRVLGESKISDIQKWQVAISEFKGKTFVNIRKWMMGEKEWHPTKKGITFPLDKVQDMVALFNKG